ncbi:MAG TPA: hypothetical protein VNR18_09680 [Hyphomicrobiales bacterium]|nr:hypothetical protein [Hyphomicrobiales bacterium]
MSQVEAFADKVECAEDLEAAVLTNYEPADLPRVLLFYGDHDYLSRENNLRASQEMIKQVVAVLYCTLADLDNLERTLVSTVLGYVHQAAYDHGLEASESKTKRQTSHYLARRIVFTQTTRVVRA